MNVNDLRMYPTAELSMVMFNTEKYYTCMARDGLTAALRLFIEDDGLYTQEQCDMLGRDFFDHEEFKI